MARAYRLAYSRAALAYLETIELRRRRTIVAKIEALPANPHPVGSRLVHGMKDGEERVFRIRWGPYRVLYVVRDDEIAVLDVGHRREIYR